MKNLNEYVREKQNRVAENQLGENQRDDKTFNIQQQRKSVRTR